MAAQNTFLSLVTAVAVMLSTGSVMLCAQPCLTGDFDAQLQQLLHEQMLSPQDHTISQALEDIQATLNQRWQGYELIFCGSLATGLSIKTSDIDLFVKIPNFNASAGLYVLNETEKLFKKQPELYTNLRSTNNVYMTFFSFLHITSNRIGEIEFRTGDMGVSNSRVVKYYFNLDKRFLSLGVFLKYFFKKHEAVGHGRHFLPGYGLYMLIIFYLQQKNMVPSGYELQTNSKSHFVDIWNMGFNELPYSSTSTENLYQLLGGFFKYYNEFNFEKYIVSPFIGHPIPRSAYIDIENFPQEYNLYNSTLLHPIQIAIQNNLDVTADLCIQDIFMHDTNTGAIPHEQAMKFKYLLKSVARMFEELPSESILEAILVTDQQESVNMCHNATVDEINEIK